jgi:S-adenosyl-L-methionine hydrolase (adenosine-forming)
VSGVALVTLLTDFGTADYYVAAVKGVLLRLAPGATLIDLTHEVPPGDVSAGAFLLAAASRWYPPGTVHLAVVDPGVGGERRILAARAGDALFVGPDNGLLTGVLAGDDEVRAVDRADLYLPGPGATFHGRDRFAPIAAALARGTPLAELGPAIDDPVRLPGARPRCDGTPGEPGTTLHGRVVWIDRFGDLVTDIPTDWLGERPCTAEVACHATGHRAGHFAEIPAGEAAALPGSLGTLELALDGADLAARWGVARGAPVSVRLG